MNEKAITSYSIGCNSITSNEINNEQMIQDTAKCFFVENSNESKNIRYLVTAYHIFQKYFIAKNQYTFYYKIKDKYYRINLDHKNNIFLKFYDLALIFIDEKLPINYVNLNMNKYTLDDIDKLYLKNQDNKFVEIKDVSIITSNILKNFKDLPGDRIEAYIIEGRFDNNEITEGDSGSPVYFQNDVYGIQFGVRTKASKEMYVNIIPFYLVKRITDEFLIKGRFDGLCQKFPRVNTNRYLDEGKKIYSTDIIESIDSNKYEKGCIFNEILQISIPLGMYILLFKTIDDAISYNVSRRSKLIGRKPKTITQGCRDIDSSINISFNEELIFIYKNNCTYAKININLYEFLNEYFEQQINMKLSDKNLNKLNNKFKLKYSNYGPKNDYLLIESDTYNISRNFQNPIIETF